jgi:hypothetical protein
MSVFVAFLLVSANAAADPQPTAAPQVASPVEPAKKAKEKKICRTDENSDPGSHMIKRVCKTAEEWNQQPNYGISRSGFSISGDAMQGH